MEQQNIFKEYYKNLKEEDIWLPSRSTWRLFKFRIIENGEYKIMNIHNQIYSKKQLLKYLRKWNPIDCWYSSNLFLNPLTLRSKDRKDSHFVQADNIFLGTDIFPIDLDTKNPDKLKYVLDTFKEYELDRLTETNRGYHIIYKNNYIPCLKVSKRMKRFQKYRMKLVQNIRYIDKMISYNPKGVIRLPNTLHNSGFKIINVPLQEALSAPESSIKSDEPTPLQDICEVDKLVPVPSPNYAYYLSSTVKGIKNRQCIILVYRKSDDYEKHLENLRKKYKIDSFYLLEADEFIYAISLKTTSLENYIKIMKHSKSCNRNCLYKFHQNFIRVSPLYYEGKIIKPMPKFLKQLGEDNSKTYCSLPHYNYLKSIDTDISKAIQPLHGELVPKIQLVVSG